MTEFSIIDSTVKMGANVTVMPFAVVLGNTVLGDGCVVESFSFLKDCEIGANTVVRSSRITDSTVGANCTLGPNCHLRDNTTVGDGCRIGNYVEIKNSTIDEGCKISHLAYVGDATVKANCNVGCGVVFVNYDGKTKHHTTVGEGCFIGCNSNLIAPLNIGDRCYVAASSTVDKDMPSGSFGVGRTHLTVKENYASKYFNK